MKKDNDYFIDPFLKILPTIDVHGEYGDTVVAVIKDFVSTNYLMGKTKIAVIHGRGGNVLKNAIHSYLKSDDKVTKYYLYPGNIGVTIIELKPLVKFL